MQSNDHAVHVLNSLIETTLDSVNGYRKAAEDVRAPELRSLFEQKAGRRAQISTELQGEVRSFGGDPKTDQSTLGALHNKFVDLKSGITGGSDKAVVDEVERGEDFIKAKFEKATDDGDLPPTARELIQKALGAIRSDHDEVSRLKHQMN
ncbi:MAG: ferritin-like domain-containing protein [Caulobacteraceae bacterium]